MAGETSPVAARRVSAILGATIPGAHVRTVAGAGHMGPVTHAGEVNAAIADHIGASAATATFSPSRP